MQLDFTRFLDFRLPSPFLVVRAYNEAQPFAIVQLRNLLNNDASA